MKRLLHLWGPLAFVTLLSITACQDKESVGPADLSFTSAEFVLADLNALAKPHLKDGCDEKAFSIQTVSTVKSERQSLSYILPTLNLQANQAASIRGHAKDHQRATSVHSGSISIIHQDILKRANSERDLLVKSYNEKQISKEQLDQKLQVLQEKVTLELSSHEQKQEHLRSLRSYRSELMQNIESTLDRAQLQQWNNWKESLQS